MMIFGWKDIVNNKIVHVYKTDSYNYTDMQHFTLEKWIIRDCIFFFSTYIYYQSRDNVLEVIYATWNSICCCSTSIISLYAYLIGNWCSLYNWPDIYICEIINLSHSRSKKTSSFVLGDRLSIITWHVFVQWST